MRVSTHLCATFGHFLGRFNEGNPTEDGSFLSLCADAANFAAFRHTGQNGFNTERHWDENLTMIGTRCQVYIQMDFLSKKSSTE